MFDRNVDAKGGKTKDSKVTVHSFLNETTKKVEPGKFGSASEQNLLDTLKNLAKLKEYKLTPQWVRLRLHLLNVQDHPWKLHFIVTWKIMDTSTFRECLPKVTYWLACRHEQTVDYVFVQATDPFSQSFISRTGADLQNFLTMNKQKFSNLLLFQFFPTISKPFSFSLV